MKIGFRTPSISRSVKARTTGRVKRTAKKAVNPLYGQKGMGYVNNPKKAVYNKVYNQTTVGIDDISISKSKSNNKSNNNITELPLNFYFDNKSYIDKKENRLVKFATESKKKMEPEQKLNHFDKMIKYYYDMKTEFYNKGPLFKMYFQSSWEHCSNSKNSDFEYIKPYEEKAERLRKRLNK